MSGAGVIGLDPTEVSTAAEVANGQSKHRLGSVGSTIVDGVYKEFKWIQYSGGAAAVIAVVEYFTAYVNVANGGIVSNIVTPDYSDTAGIGAGQLAGTPEDGGHGWVQISGPAHTALVAVTTDGHLLTIIAAADAAVAPNTLVTDHICAICDDYSAETILITCPR